EELRLSGAVGRNGVEVEVAAVLDAEDDPVAVPDRLPDSRVRLAVPVEGRGEDAALASAGRNDCDLAVMRRRAVVWGVVVRDEGAVGGERRATACFVFGGKPARLGTVGVDIEDVNRLA